MAIAPTADFDELVLEVEFDPVGASGTYTKVCGLKGYTITRTNNTDTTEVPDCADESLPFYLKRAVRSQDTTISGTGSWSLSSDKLMKDWFRNGTTLNVKVTNAKVTADGTTGDEESETIPMILTSMSNEKTKGQVISFEISLEQNGSVTVTEIA